MWNIYLPTQKLNLEPDYITVDYRINAVSTATINFTDMLTIYDWDYLRNVMKIGEPVQILKDSEIMFNGYITNIIFDTKQQTNSISVTLFDPLGKLTKMSFKGGFSGKLRDLLEQEICKFIKINNWIFDDVQINLRYEEEVTRFSLLLDALYIARCFTDPTHYAFYYDHQNNALRKLDINHPGGTLNSIPTENRISYSESYGYIISNVIQVTNTID